MSEGRKESTMENNQTYPRCKIKLFIPENTAKNGAKQLRTVSPQDIVAIALALNQTLKVPPTRSAWGANATNVILRAEGPRR
jgi:hypothetical protein